MLLLISPIRADLRACVSMLDDRHDGAILPDDTAVPGGVGHSRRQNGRGGALCGMGVDQPLERAGPEQRSVPGQHHERSATPGERLLGLEKRMPGSQLRFLDDDGHRRPRRQPVSHEIRPVPDDHRGRRRTQRVARTKDVLDHWKAADLVQHLGHR